MKYKLKKTLIGEKYVIEAYQGYEEMPDMWSDTGATNVTELSSYKLMITPLDRSGKYTKYDFNKESFVIISSDKQLLNRIAYSFNHGNCTIDDLNRCFGRGLMITEGWLWHLGGDVREV